jgi:hypothetical protein
VHAVVAVGSSGGVLDNDCVKLDKILNTFTK